MDRLNDIYIGWKNYVFPNQEIEIKAKERMEFCVEKCDKLKQSNFCSVCGCFMPAKVRNPKMKCPIKKW